ncbi:DUF6108 family protein [Prevotella sp. oral taxon 376]|uniref:DUF6108 family protein n=1 Tax=Prevotella sp. oral taxon 376 TaxID=712466 RepID=UPI001E5E0CE7|nr:DUF6108 family protein [Prevotella sp. oral taxon 376]
MRNRMKTVMTIATLFLWWTMPSFAQKDLQIGQAFERFGRSKGCKLVVLNDAELKGYRLRVYKALTYKRLSGEVSEYLKADRKKARKIREVVAEGRITSGYYQMPSSQKGINRYILFANETDQSGALIYIEGTLESDDILKLCYGKR